MGVGKDLNGKWRVNGDPWTEYMGKKMQFWLEISKRTSLFRYPLGIEVVVVGGPKVKTKGFAQRLEWMTEIYVMLNGVQLVSATVRQSVKNVAELMRGGLPASKITSKMVEAGDAEEKGDANMPPPLRQLPASKRAAVGLTTLNMTVMKDNAIKSTGDFFITGAGVPVNISITQDLERPMGIGYGEKAVISVGTDFKMALWTSKADRFAQSLADQLMYSHLDFKLLKFDHSKAEGALPEMWGLRPMTNTTKALLVEPH